MVERTLGLGCLMSRFWLREEREDMDKLLRDLRRQLKHRILIAERWRAQCAELESQLESEFGTTLERDR